MSASHRKKYNQEPKASLRSQCNAIPLAPLRCAGLIAYACCLASTGAWKQIPSVVLQWGFLFRKSL